MFLQSTLYVSICDEISTDQKKLILYSLELVNLSQGITKVGTALKGHDINLDSFVVLTLNKAVNLTPLSGRSNEYFVDFVHQQELDHIVKYGNIGQREQALQSLVRGRSKLLLETVCNDDCLQTMLDCLFVGIGLKRYQISQKITSVVVIFINYYIKTQE